MTNKPILLLALAAILPARLPADEPPDPAPVLSRESASAWRLDWTGAEGWTYFVQWSADLVEWQSFPFVDQGPDPDPFHFSTTAERFFLRIVSTDSDDPDGDGLSTADEFANLSDPLNPDTDGDGLSDGLEVLTLLTYPDTADSDADGWSDGYEHNTSLTDPLKMDTDGDGIPDGDDLQPLAVNTDPAPAAYALVVWTNLEAPN